MEMIKWKNNYSVRSNKKANPPNECTDTIILKHPPLIRGRKKKTSLDPFKYKNILYYIEFYKIPLLNTSSQTPAKWEDYC